MSEHKEPPSFAAQIHVYICPTPGCGNFYGSSTMPPLDERINTLSTMHAGEARLKYGTADTHSRAECPDCRQRMPPLLVDRILVSRQIRVTGRSWAENWEMLEAAQEWELEHGSPPRQSDWGADRDQRLFPAFHSVIRRFGSWNAFIEQAGFTPRPQGFPEDMERSYNPTFRRDRELAARAGEKGAATHRRESSHWVKSLVEKEQGEPEPMGQGEADGAPT